MEREKNSFIRNQMQFSAIADRGPCPENNLYYNYGDDDASDDGSDAGSECYYGGSDNGQTMQKPVTLKQKTEGQEQEDPETSATTFSGSQGTGKRWRIIMGTIVLTLALIVAIGAAAIIVGTAATAATRGPKTSTGTGTGE